MGYNCRIMRKYLFWLAMLVAVSCLVTSLHEKYTHDSAYQGGNSNAAVAGTNSPKAKNNEANAKWYSPSGDLYYLIFGWPNGVTVWALFLTLVVIADQTYQTSRAADTGKTAAEAALLQAKHMETTERAWLLISFVSMKDRELKDGEVATCHWAIKNVGSTPAILLETKTRFHVIRLYDEMPEDPVKALPIVPDYGSPIAINERLLAPQDSIGYFTKWERNTDGAFSEFAFRTKANEVWMVVAYGYVKYKDIFGKERESRTCDFTCIGRSDNIPLDFHPHPKVPGAYNRCA